MHFDTFNDLRKESYSFVKEYREHFVRIVLNKHKVPYNENLSKREKAELFDKMIIGIVNDKERNLDMIYKEGNLIGYWNKDFDIFFRKGRLFCRIEYRIY
jgi:hypothetical protein